MSSQREILQLMGVQSWGLRTSEECVPEEPEIQQTPVEQIQAVESVVPVNSEPVSRLVDQIEPEPVAEETPVPVTLPSNLEQMDWQVLEQTVSACQQCDLCKTRNQTVFGVGNQTTNVLVVGEAPGAEEDKQGEPFVGRAGKLLDQMLWATGYARSDVYIANVIKCRPPNNRDPSVDEMALCQGYLKRQITLIQPQVILAVGRIAAQTLLQSTERIGRLRGKVHYETAYNVPIVVTYHPAYLLRSPHEKAKSWLDLKLAKSVIQS